MQRQALATLQEIDVSNERLIGAVAPLLQSDNADLRRDAVAVLHRCGPPALPHLVRALRDPSEPVREQVVIALQNVGSEAKELHGALVEAFQDKDVFVRAGALEALAKRFGTKCIPQLETGIKDDKPLVRRVAVWGLGKFGGLKKTPCWLPHSMTGTAVSGSRHISACPRCRSPPRTARNCSSSCSPLSRTKTSRCGRERCSR